MTVADLSTVWLSASVAEKDMSQMFVGQSARIVPNAYASREFDGKVKYIGDLLDPDTRTVRVRVAIDNRDGLFKPGMFARVSLVLAQRENALLVPEQAIVPRGDGQFAFRVVEGKARLTKVETGLRRPGEVEVTSGLEAGQTIVADGQLKLQDGAAVSLPKPGPQTPPQPVK